MEEAKGISKESLVEKAKEDIRDAGASNVDGIAMRYVRLLEYYDMNDGAKEVYDYYNELWS